MILNSAFVPERDWVQLLEASGETTPAIDEVLSTLNDERATRNRAAARITDAFSRRYPSLPNFVCPSSSLWNHEASFTRFRKASTSLRCSSVSSTNRYQVWIWAHALSRTMPSA
ncbi:MAG: hypothetical protein DRH30_08890 [Deltaproteobacteria bacterium]|nr:MAG: hypothetical protein DRH30_08890 [Deltaproteobacteria bacterium]